jgi:heme-degrading monooxygenase HmoA
VGRAVTVASISAGGGLATFINVFTCEPASQNELLMVLRHETESVVSRLPGFVSANLHRSTDGRRVVNYAQWDDLGAFQELMAGERGRALIASVRCLATGVDVHVYSVDSVLVPRTG